MIRFLQWGTTSSGGAFVAMQNGLDGSRERGSILWSPNNKYRSWQSFCGALVHSGELLGDADWILI